MKTIIAGSRTIWDYQLIHQAVEESGFDITEVVCGYAPGVDTVGEAWAIVNGIPYKYIKPDWGGLGKAAGHIRNKEMAEYADALIAVWTGLSPGTRSMIRFAKERRLKIYVKNLSKIKTSGLFVDRI